MKTNFFVLAVLAAFSIPMSAQPVPGLPEDHGLTPKSETIYVNRLTPEGTVINNGKTESLGVAIASGGNVIVGWEDDAVDAEATPLLDLEAVWTIYDSAGVSLTPETTLKSLAIPAAGEITSRFLSYFRADKSAVPGGTSWGPKIKANLFGEGVGMGATSFYLGEEVAAFAAYDDLNMGDFSSVQLLSNRGEPIAILAGITSAYATRDAGNIRIADWDFLSNSNIVIVSESRQNADLASLYGGTEEATHVIFRILDLAGQVVKSETLVSDTPYKTEMWHGLGVVKDGFAIRFSSPSGAMIRLFDNQGNPTSTNIDIGALTGFPITSSGGRGEETGFHGNGLDAYVLSNKGIDSESGLARVWVTVFNTNGTVRYSKSAIDDLELSSIGRTDAAMDGKGEVIVVFSGKYHADFPSLVMGRRLDPTGRPLGKTFHVSEKELPDGSALEAVDPRIAWRNGQVAVVWESRNDLDSLDPATGEPMSVVALRIYSTFTIGSIENAGLTRLVPDKPVIVPDYDALGNWEPYISVLGTSTFLIEGNTFAESTSDMQRYVVALQPADGRPGSLVEGFYTDAGQPFKDPINASRQNGNPGRVCGDARPGAVNYMVGGEASPHTLSPAFTSDNRWNLGYDRLSDGRYGVIQIFQLDPATLTPTPLSKALDSANGRETSGAPPGNQITRFGGDMVCLDNGNFVSVVEDRGRTRNPDSDVIVATIFAPDGSIVKESWVVATGDIWSNVAACQRGFAVRAKPADGSATRVIYFFDNAGNLKGSVDQADSGASFDTGRGDGTRIFGHINSPFVFLTGRAANTKIIKVAAFDSRDQKFAAMADVNEGAFTGDFDRANGAADALNRLTVSWVSQPAGYANQQVAARVLAFDGAAKKFTPLTPSFLPFLNAATNTVRTLQMSVAMTTKQICVAAKGEINLQNRPEQGANSPREINFYTVFTHPVPKDDPTPSIGGSTIPRLLLHRTGQTLTLSWDAAMTGFTLESKSNLSDSNWTAIGTQNPTTDTLGTASKFYRLRK